MEKRPEFIAEFSRRVRRRRRLLDLTQAEVAEHLGMHRGQFARLEGGGYRSMQLEQLAALAQVLRTSTDYLLQRVEEDPGEIPPLGRSGEQLRPESMAALPATIISHGDASYDYST